MKRQVRAWLKAKIVIQEEIIFPEKGTPQGGILSPLLANIALNGIEERLSDWIAEIPAFIVQEDIESRNRTDENDYYTYATLTIL
jgi:retron-type reverse transcriptase